MKIAVDIFATDQTITPIEFARVAEDLGFESVWFAEHYSHPHKPSDSMGWHHGGTSAAGLLRTDLRPVRRARRLRRCYDHDQAGDGHLHRGPTRSDPHRQEVASVDALSGGRMLFGVGYGWNKEEMSQHGTHYGQRRALLRERILAMQALWTEDEASFAGDLVRVEPSWAWPKPVQQPHPPIILGGAAGPTTARHIAEFCDGWMPIGGQGLKTGWDDVRRACDNIGRDPQSIELGVFNASRDEGKLTDLAKFGVTRAVVTMSPGSPEEVINELKQTAPLIDALRAA